MFTTHYLKIVSQNAQLRSVRLGECSLLKKKKSQGEGMPRYKPAKKKTVLHKKVEKIFSDQPRLQSFLEESCRKWHKDILCTF